MDLDALSAGVLAGAAGGRAAYGNRHGWGRRAAITWKHQLCALMLYSGIVCTAFANWAMTMVNRSLPAVTTSLWLACDAAALGIVSAIVILGEPVEPSLFDRRDIDRRRHRARHPGGGSPVRGFDRNRNLVSLSMICAAQTARLRASSTRYAPCGRRAADPGPTRENRSRLAVHR